MAAGEGGNRHRTWNTQHSRRLAQYNARLERILKRAVVRAASSVSRRNATATDETPFTFGSDRTLDSEIDHLMKDLAADITSVTQGAERSEWDKAQSQAVRYLTDLYDVAEQSKGRQEAFNETMLKMRSRNLDAYGEFQSRKIGGMELSEKVWGYTEDFKSQMEVAIDTALLEGKSAASLAQSVQGLLTDPDALFRRVRDIGGALRLSKAAAAFHPGKGKYRSAHKNAMRLARTEINMAYRASDCNVAQSLDCVVGIRVNLSNNHNCEGVPTGQFTDICDQLKGDYPKDFKFTGWHPQCRCFITYITKTDDEFWRDLESGENNGSVNTVKDVPTGFKDWVRDNTERMEKAEKKGSLPYFLKDNMKTVEKIKVGKAETKTGTIGIGSQKQPMSTQPTAKSNTVLKAKKVSKKKLYESELPTNLTDDERKAIVNNIVKIENKMGVSKGNPMNFDDANGGKSNPNYGDIYAITKGYRHNCQTCTVSYELRRRGFKVGAKPNPNTMVRGKWHSEIDDYMAKHKMNWKTRFLNPDGSKANYQWSKLPVDASDIDKLAFIENETLVEGRYEIYCAWKTNSAHVFSLERLNDGTLLWYDPQSGLKGDDVKKYLASMKGNLIGIMIIDNKIINPNFVGRLTMSNL